MEQTLEQPTLVPASLPDFKEAWEMVRGQLHHSMRRGEYETWVEPLQPISFKEGLFRVGAVNVYGRDWVESRLRSQITRLLEGVLHQPVTLSFVLLNGTPVEVVTQTAPEPEITNTNGSSRANGTRKKKQPEEGGGEASPRKIQLQRAYGTERARVIQPERGMFLTRYFFENWLPLLGHSAMATVMAARFLCYWNPMTGEMRNVIETDMADLARRASVSVRTVKDVLNSELVKRYFLRYKVRRVMTPNGVRTAGIILQVRMDDPLTPEDQESQHLAEAEYWYTTDFIDEEED